MGHTALDVDLDRSKESLLLGRAHVRYLLLDLGLDVCFVVLCVALLCCLIFLLGRIELLSILR